MNKQQAETAPQEQEYVPHTVRAHVAKRYHDVDKDAYRADELSKDVLAVYLHGRAEALADAMVDILIPDLAARETWRQRANEHNRAGREAFERLQASLTAVVAERCSVELPERRRR